MPRGTAQLVITGNTLTMEETEQLANYLRQALKMVPMGNVNIEVGQITYEGHPLQSQEVAS